MANVVLLRTRYFQPKRAQVRSGAPKAFLYLAPAPAFFLPIKFHYAAAGGVFKIFL